MKYQKRLPGSRPAVGGITLFGKRSWGELLRVRENTILNLTTIIFYLLFVFYCKAVHSETLFDGVADNLHLHSLYSEFISLEDELLLEGIIVSGPKYVYRDELFELELSCNNGSFQIKEEDNYLDLASSLNFLNTSSQRLVLFGGELDNIFHKIRYLPQMYFNGTDILSLRMVYLGNNIWHDNGFMQQSKTDSKLQFAVQVNGRRLPPQLIHPSTVFIERSKALRLGSVFSVAHSPTIEFDLHIDAAVNSIYSNKNCFHFDCNVSETVAIFSAHGTPDVINNALGVAYYPMMESTTRALPWVQRLRLRALQEENTIATGYIDVITTQDDDNITISLSDRIVSTDVWVDGVFVPELRFPNSSIVNDTSNRWLVKIEALHGEVDWAKKMDLRGMTFIVHSKSHVQFLGRMNNVLRALQGVRYRTNKHDRVSLTMKQEFHASEFMVSTAIVELEDGKPELGINSIYTPKHALVVIDEAEVSLRGAFSIRGSGGFNMSIELSISSNYGRFYIPRAVSGVSIQPASYDRNAWRNKYLLYGHVIGVTEALASLRYKCCENMVKRKQQTEDSIMVQLNSMGQGEVMAVVPTKIIPSNQSIDMLETEIAEGTPKVQLTGTSINTNLSVQASVLYGTLSLDATFSVNVSSIFGTDSATLKLVGTMKHLNIALKQLAYDAPSGHCGNETITYSVESKSKSMTFDVQCATLDSMKLVLQSNVAIATGICTLVRLNHVVVHWGNFIEGNEIELNVTSKYGGLIPSILPETSLPTDLINCNVNSSSAISMKGSKKVLERFLGALDFLAVWTPNGNDEIHFSLSGGSYSDNLLLPVVVYPGRVKPYIVLDFGRIEAQHLERFALKGIHLFTENNSYIFPSTRIEMQVIYDTNGCVLYASVVDEVFVSDIDNGKRISGSYEYLAKYVEDGLYMQFKTTDVPLANITFTVWITGNQNHARTTTLKILSSNLLPLSAMVRLQNTIVIEGVEDQDLILNFECGFIKNNYDMATISDLKVQFTVNASIGNLWIDERAIKNVEMDVIYQGDATNSLHLHCMMSSLPHILNEALVYVPETNSNFANANPPLVFLNVWSDKTRFSLEYEIRSTAKIYLSPAIDKPVIYGLQDKFVLGTKKVLLFINSSIEDPDAMATHKRDLTLSIRNTVPYMLQYDSNLLISGVRVDHSNATVLELLGSAVELNKFAQQGIFYSNNTQMYASKDIITITIYDPSTIDLQDTNYIDIIQEENVAELQLQSCGSDTADIVFLNKAPVFLEDQSIALSGFALAYASNKYCEHNFNEKVMVNVTVAHGRLYLKMNKFVLVHEASPTKLRVQVPSFFAIRTLMESIIYHPAKNWNSVLQRSYEQLSITCDRIQRSSALGGHAKIVKMVEFSVLGVPDKLQIRMGGPSEAVRIFRSGQYLPKIVMNDPDNVSSTNYLLELRVNMGSLCTNHISGLRLYANFKVDEDCTNHHDKRISMKGPMSELNRALQTTQYFNIGEGENDTLVILLKPNHENVSASLNVSLLLSKSPLKVQLPRQYNFSTETYTVQPSEEFSYFQNLRLEGNDSQIVFIDVYSTLNGTFRCQSHFIDNSTSYSMLPWGLTEGRILQISGSISALTKSLASDQCVYVLQNSSCGSSSIGVQLSTGIWLKRFTIEVQCKIARPLIHAKMDYFSLKDIAPFTLDQLFRLEYALPYAPMLELSLIATAEGGALSAAGKLNLQHYKKPNRVAVIVLWGDLESSIAAISFFPVQSNPHAAITLAVCSQSHCCSVTVPIKVARQLEPALKSTINHYSTIEDNPVNISDIHIIGLDVDIPLVLTMKSVFGRIYFDMVSGVQHYDNNELSLIGTQDTLNEMLLSLRYMPLDEFSGVWPENWVQQDDLELLQIAVRQASGSHTSYLDIKVSVYAVNDEPSVNFEVPLTLEYGSCISLRGVIVRDNDTSDDLVVDISVNSGYLYFYAVQNILLADVVVNRDILYSNTKIPEPFKKKHCRVHGRESEINGLLGQLLFCHEENSLDIVQLSVSVSDTHVNNTKKRTIEITSSPKVATFQCEETIVAEQAKGINLNSTIHAIGMNATQDYLELNIDVPFGAVAMNSTCAKYQLIEYPVNHIEIKAEHIFGASNISEIQHLVCNVGNGAFTLSTMGYTSRTVYWNSSLHDFEAALQAIPVIKNVSLEYLYEPSIDCICSSTNATPIVARFSKRNIHRIAPNEKRLPGIQLLNMTNPGIVNVSFRHANITDTVTINFEAAAEDYIKAQLEKLVNIGRVIVEEYNHAWKVTFTTLAGQIELLTPVGDEFTFEAFEVRPGSLSPPKQTIVLHYNEPQTSGDFRLRLHNKISSRVPHSCTINCMKNVFENELNAGIVLVTSMYTDQIRSWTIEFLSIDITTKIIPMWNKISEGVDHCAECIPFHIPWSGSSPQVQVMDNFAELPSSPRYFQLNFVNVNSDLYLVTDSLPHNSTADIVQASILSTLTTNNVVPYKGSEFVYVTWQEDMWVVYLSNFNAAIGMDIRAIGVNMNILVSCISIGTYGPIGNLPELKWNFDNAVEGLATTSELQRGTTTNVIPSIYVLSTNKGDVQEKQSIFTIGKTVGALSGHFMLSLLGTTFGPVAYNAPAMASDSGGDGTSLAELIENLPFIDEVVVSRTINIESTASEAYVWEILFLKTSLSANEVYGFDLPEILVVSDELLNGGIVGSTTLVDRDNTVGRISMYVEGKRLGSISSDVCSAKLKSKLESLPNIGEVGVTRTDGIAKGLFTWSITFLDGYRNISVDPVILGSGTKLHIETYQMGYPPQASFQISIGDSSNANYDPIFPTSNADDVRSQVNSAISFYFKAKTNVAKVEKLRTGNWKLAIEDANIAQHIYSLLRIDSFKSELLSGISFYYTMGFQMKSNLENIANCVQSFVYKGVIPGVDQLSVILTTETHTTKKILFVQSPNTNTPLSLRWHNKGVQVAQNSMTLLPPFQFTNRYSFHVLNASISAQFGKIALDVDCEGRLEGMLEFVLGKACQYHRKLIFSGNLDNINTALKHVHYVSDNRNDPQAPAPVKYVLEITKLLGPKLQKIQSSVDTGSISGTMILNLNFSSFFSHAPHPQVPDTNAASCSSLSIPYDADASVMKSSILACMTGPTGILDPTVREQEIQQVSATMLHGTGVPFNFRLSIDGVTSTAIMSTSLDINSFTDVLQDSLGLNGVVVTYGTNTDLQKTWLVTFPLEMENVKQLKVASVHNSGYIAVSVETIVDGGFTDSFSSLVLVVERSDHDMEIGTSTWLLSFFNIAYAPLVSVAENNLVSELSAPMLNVNCVSDVEYLSHGYYFAFGNKISNYVTHNASALAIKQEILNLGYIDKDSLNVIFLDSGKFEISFASPISSNSLSVQYASKTSGFQVQLLLVSNGTMFKDRVDISAKVVGELEYQCRGTVNIDILPFKSNACKQPKQYFLDTRENVALELPKMDVFDATTVHIQCYHCSLRLPNSTKNKTVVFTHGITTHGSREDITHALAEVFYVPDKNFNGLDVVKFDGEYISHSTIQVKVLGVNNSLRLKTSNTTFYQPKTWTYVGRSIDFLYDVKKEGCGGILSIKISTKMGGVLKLIEPFDSFVHYLAQNATAAASTIEFFGSLRNIQKAIKYLVYWNTNKVLDKLQFFVSDIPINGVGSTREYEMTLRVQAKLSKKKIEIFLHPPVHSLTDLYPTTYFVVEDTAFPLSIVVLGNTEYLTRMEVQAVHGKIVTSINGDGATSVQFSGNFTEINSALQFAKYIPAKKFTGTESLSIRAIANGSISTKQVELMIIKGNNLPYFRGSDNFTTFKYKAPLPWLNLEGPDRDAWLQLNVSALNGTLSVFGAPDERDLSVQGTMEDVNAFLASLVYVIPKNCAHHDIISLVAYNIYGSSNAANDQLDSDVSHTLNVYVQQRPVKDVWQQVTFKSRKELSTIQGRSLDIGGIILKGMLDCDWRIATSLSISVDHGTIGPIHKNLSFISFSGTIQNISQLLMESIYYHSNTNFSGQDQLVYSHDKIPIAHTTIHVATAKLQPALLFKNLPSFSALSLDDSRVTIDGLLIEAEDIFQEVEVVVWIESNDHQFGFQIFTDISILTENSTYAALRGRAVDVNQTLNTMWAQQFNEFHGNVAILTFHVRLHSDNYFTSALDFDVSLPSATKNNVAMYFSRQKLEVSEKVIHFFEEEMNLISGITLGERNILDWNAEIRITSETNKTTISFPNIHACRFERFKDIISSSLPCLQALVEDNLFLQRRPNKHGMDRLHLEFQGQKSTIEVNIYPIDDLPKLNIASTEHLHIGQEVIGLGDLISIVNTDGQQQLWSLNISTDNGRVYWKSSYMAHNVEFVEPNAPLLSRYVAIRGNVHDINNLLAQEFLRFSPKYARNSTIFVAASVDSYDKRGSVKSDFASFYIPNSEQHLKPQFIGINDTFKKLRSETWSSLFENAEIVDDSDKLDLRIEIFSTSNKVAFITHEANMTESSKISSRSGSAKFLTSWLQSILVSASSHMLDEDTVSCQLLEENSRVHSVSMNIRIFPSFRPSKIIAPAVLEVNMGEAAMLGKAYSIDVENRYCNLMLCVKSSFGNVEIEEPTPDTGHNSKSPGEILLYGKPHMLNGALQRVKYFSTGNILGANQLFLGLSQCNDTRNIETQTSVTVRSIRTNGTPKVCVENIAWQLGESAFNYMSDVNDQYYMTGIKISDRDSGTSDLHEVAFVSHGGRFTFPFVVDVDITRFQNKTMLSGTHENLNRAIKRIGFIKSHRDVANIIHVSVKDGDGLEGSATIVPPKTRIPANMKTLVPLHPIIAVANIASPVPNLAIVSTKESINSIVNVSLSCGHHYLPQVQEISIHIPYHSAVQTVTRFGVAPFQLALDFQEFGGTLISTGLIFADAVARIENELPLAILSGGSYGESMESKLKSIIPPNFASVNLYVSSRTKGSWTIEFLNAGTKFPKLQCNDSNVVTEIGTPASDLRGTFFVHLGHLHLGPLSPQISASSLQHELEKHDILARVSKKILLETRKWSITFIFPQEKIRTESSLLLDSSRMNRNFLLDEQVHLTVNVKEGHGAVNAVQYSIRSHSKRGTEFVVLSTGSEKLGGDFRMAFGGKLSDIIYHNAVAMIRDEHAAAKSSVGSSMQAILQKLLPFDIAIERGISDVHGNFAWTITYFESPLDFPIPTIYTNRLTGMDATIVINMNFAANTISGFYKVNCAGQTSTDIAYNATASTIASSLVKLPCFHNFVHDDILIRQSNIDSQNGKSWTLVILKENPWVQDFQFSINTESIYGQNVYAEVKPIVPRSKDQIRASKLSGLSFAPTVKIYDSIAQSDILSFVGSIEDANQALSSLEYVPFPDWYGNATCFSRVSCAGDFMTDYENLYSEAKFDVSVNKAPIFPIIHLRESKMQEDETLKMDRFEIVLDSGSDIFDFTLSVSYGLFFKGGNQPKIVLHGNLHEIFARLKEYIFIPPKNYEGRVVFTSDFNDLIQEHNLLVVSVPDLPIIRINGSQEAPYKTEHWKHILTIPEDSMYHITGMYIQDFDLDQYARYTLCFRVAHGTVFLEHSMGINVVHESVDSGSFEIKFAGQIGSINRALGEVYYMPQNNFNGLDQLQIAVFKEGLQFSRVVQIVISSRVDPPVLVVNNFTLYTNEDIPIRLTGISLKDNDDINGILHGNWLPEVEDAGIELWSSAIGIANSDKDSWRHHMILDINHGTQSSNPKFFTSGGNYFYFQATDIAHGSELWISDGKNTTQLLVDIVPGKESSNPSYLCMVQGLLGFSAIGVDMSWMLPESRQDLCRSNKTFKVGKFELLFAVSESNEWIIGGSYSCPAGFRWISTNEATSIFNSAVETENNFMYWNTCGWNQYSWGGTSRKRFRFADSDVTGAFKHAGKSVHASVEYNFMTSEFAGSVCLKEDSLSRHASQTGTELWLWDGLEPRLVKDINRGPMGSNPKFMTQFENTNYIIFQADDGYHGIELWQTDLTYEHTQILSDINNGAGSSNPAQFKYHDCRIYFAAAADSGRELWSTTVIMDDRSGEHTRLELDICSGPASSNPTQLHSFGSLMLFQADDCSHGPELWILDSAHDIFMLKDINPGIFGSFPSHFATFDTMAYFQADDGVHGPELWTTDGTLEGTRILFDLVPGDKGSHPQYLSSFTGMSSNLIQISGFSFFAAGQLWNSDGTESGTRMTYSTTVPKIGVDGKLFKFGNSFIYGAKDIRSTHHSPKFSISAEVLETYSLSIMAYKGKLSLESPTLTDISYTNTSITLNGTLSQLNYAVRGIVFSPIQNWNSEIGFEPANVVFTIKDKDKLWCSEEVSIHVSPVPDLPQILVPNFTDCYSLDNNLSVSCIRLSERQGHISNIRIIDVDQGDAMYFLNIYSTHGILNMRALTFHDTVKNLNTAIRHLTYDAKEIYQDEVTMQISKEDLGIVFKTFRVSVRVNERLNFFPATKYWEAWGVLRMNGLAITSSFDKDTILDMKILTRFGQIYLGYLNESSMPAHSVNSNNVLRMTGTITSLQKSLNKLLYVSAQNWDSLTKLVHDTVQFCFAVGDDYLDCVTHYVFVHRIAYVVKLDIGGIKSSNVTNLTEINCAEDTPVEITGIKLVASSYDQDTVFCLVIRLDNGRVKLRSTNGLLMGQTNETFQQYYGSYEAIQNSISCLQYQGHLNYHGQARIQMYISYWFGADEPIGISIPVIVHSVHDAAIWSVPTSPIVVNFEDKKHNFHDVSFNDPDSQAENLTLSVDVRGGTVATSDSRYFTSYKSVIGTQNYLNALLNGMVFHLSETFALKGRHGTIILSIEDINLQISTTEILLYARSSENASPKFFWGRTRIIDEKLSLHGQEDTPLALDRLSICDLDDKDILPDILDLNFSIAIGTLSIPTTSVSGNVELINQVLSSLLYIPPDNWHGRLTIEVVLQDSSAIRSRWIQPIGFSILVEIKPNCDALTWSLQYDTIEILEDKQTTLGVVELVDVDNSYGIQHVNISMTSNHGKFLFPEANGLVFEGQNECNSCYDQPSFQNMIKPYNLVDVDPITAMHSSHIRFSGTLQAVNLALQGLIFTPFADFNTDHTGLEEIQLVATKHCNNSVFTSRKRLYVRVHGVNDAPKIAYTGSNFNLQDHWVEGDNIQVQSIEPVYGVEDQTVYIDGISFNDVDAIDPAHSMLEVTIRSSMGAISFSYIRSQTVSNLDIFFVRGSGQLDNEVVIQGSIHDLNMLFYHGIEYDSFQNFAGNTSLQIAVSDMEYAVTLNVPMSILPQNDPPTIVIPVDNDGISTFAVSDGGKFRFAGTRQSHDHMPKIFADTSPYKLQKFKLHTGTASKTNFLKLGQFDILDFGEPENPKHFVKHGQYIYFQGYDAIHGTELWKTDGNSASIFADVLPGADGSNPLWFMRLGNNLLYAARGIDTSWMLKREDADDCDSFRRSAIDSSIRFAVSSSTTWVERKLYNCPVGYRWISSKEADQIFWHIRHFMSHIIQPFTYYNHCGWDGYVWAGQSRKKFRFSDSFENGAYKSAGRTESHAIEYDFGTSEFAGVVCRSNSFVGSDPEVRQTYENKNELWKTNLLSGVSERISDNRMEQSSFNPKYLTSVGNWVYFQARTDYSGAELWRTDGSNAGTMQVADIAKGPTSSNPKYLTEYSENVVFAANDGIFGEEIWLVSTGSTLGGQQSPSSSLYIVKDINEGHASSNPKHFTELNGIIYFQATDGVHGSELWRTDGTQPGTSLVVDIRVGVIGSNPTYMISFNSKLYFQADDGIFGPELWTSDGTSAGTVLISDLNPGHRGSRPSYITPHEPFSTLAHNSANYMVFITRSIDATRNQVWRSDGTHDGTKRFYQYSTTESSVVASVDIDYDSLSRRHPSILCILDDNIVLPARKVSQHTVYYANEFSETSGIMVFDNDNAELHIEIEILHGALTMGSTDNLVFEVGSGKNDSKMSFSGLVTDINFALSNLTYIAKLDEKKKDQIRFVVHDKAAIGSDGIGYSADKTIYIETR